MIDDDSGELLTAISQFTSEFPNTEILAVINPENQELAATAINAGASDYLLNPINSDILLSKITAITASKDNMSELMMLRQQIAMNYGFDNFIGVSLKIERIRKTAMQMALCDIPVVISGKTGTGKTLVHCAVGKDRTGFAAAIILLALGVSRETVLFDYMLTRHYLLPGREVDRLSQKYGLNIEANSILPMLEVYPEYLQAALGAIDEHYPNMEVYLDQHLGVDETARAELRGRYLA